MRIGLPKAEHISQAPAWKLVAGIRRSSTAPTRILGDSTPHYRWKASRLNSGRASWRCQRVLGRLPVESAAVVPIRLREDGDTVGFLVYQGIHPGRAFDDTYRHFVRRLAEQIAIGLVSARAYEQEHQRASERNLAAIINTIPTTAWTTRPDGYCDFLNQVWLDYAGMTAEQAQGWGWADAIHPDDRKRLVEDWQSCLASGSPVDTEARIRRFDGSYRWFLIRANPLRDESGNILKWYGTCIDIEDHKQGEEDLRARELSWREIVDSIPGLVATTGAMGEVEFLNRQTLEYFGKTSEELKNWALIGAVHPDDLSRVIEVRKKSIEAGQIYEVEHRCRRADGVYRWFQVRGLPVRDSEGTISGWYLLLTDIHDRKKAEEALQSSQRNLSLIINTMPTFAWSARPDGSVDFLNERWLDYTGLSRGTGAGLEMDRSNSPGRLEQSHRLLAIDHGHRRTGRD